MLNRVKTLVVDHFSQHITLYFVIILCFSVGIASGVFSVKALSESQKAQLTDYLVSTFQSLFSRGQINNSQVLWESISYNFKTTIIIWIMAVSIIAFPLIFFIVGIRGFVLGFTIGFLIDNLGYKGILFSLVSILPHNIIILPSYIILSVVSINYSVSIIKSRKLNKYVKSEKTKKFFAYTFLTIVIYIILISGSLIEAYISPALFKGISNYLLG